MQERELSRNYSKPGLRIVLSRMISFSLRMVPKFERPIAFKRGIEFRINHAPQRGRPDELRIPLSPASGNHFRSAPSYFSLPSPCRSSNTPRRAARCLEGKVP